MSLSASKSVNFTSASAADPAIPHHQDLIGPRDLFNHLKTHLPFSQQQEGSPSLIKQYSHLLLGTQPKSELLEKWIYDTVLIPAEGVTQQTSETAKTLLDPRSLIKNVGFTNALALLCRGYQLAYQLSSLGDHEEQQASNMAAKLYESTLYELLNELPHKDALLNLKQLTFNQADVSSAFIQALQNAIDKQARRKLYTGLGLASLGILSSAYTYLNTVSTAPVLPKPNLLPSPGNVPSPSYPLPALPTTLNPLILQRFPLYLNSLSIETHSHPQPISEVKQTIKLLSDRSWWPISLSEPIPQLESVETNETKPELIPQLGPFENAVTKSEKTHISVIPNRSEEKEKKVVFPISLNLTRICNSSKEKLDKVSQIEKEKTKIEEKQLSIFPNRIEQQEEKIAFPLSFVNTDTTDSGQKKLENDTQNTDSETPTQEPIFSTEIKVATVFGLFAAILALSLKKRRRHNPPLNIKDNDQMSEMEKGSLTHLLKENQVNPSKGLNVNAPSNANNEDLESKQQSTNTNPIDLTKNDTRIEIQTDTQEDLPQFGEDLEKLFDVPSKEISHSNGIREGHHNELKDEIPNPKNEEPPLPNQPQKSLILDPHPSIFPSSAKLSHPSKEKIDKPDVFKAILFQKIEKFNTIEQLKQFGPDPALSKHKPLLPLPEIDEDNFLPKEIKLKSLPPTISTPFPSSDLILKNEHQLTTHHVLKPPTIPKNATDEMVDLIIQEFLVLKKVDNESLWNKFQVHKRIEEATVKYESWAKIFLEAKTPQMQKESLDLYIAASALNLWLTTTLDILFFEKVRDYLKLNSLNDYINTKKEYLLQLEIYIQHPQDFYRSPIKVLTIDENSQTITVENKDYSLTHLTKTTALISYMSANFTDAFITPRGEIEELFKPIKKGLENVFTESGYAKILKERVIDQIISLTRFLYYGTAISILKNVIEKEDKQVTSEECRDVIFAQLQNNIHQVWKDQQDLKQTEEGNDLSLSQFEIVGSKVTIDGLKNEISKNNFTQQQWNQLANLENKCWCTLLTKKYQQPNNSWKTILDTQLS